MLSDDELATRSPMPITGPDGVTTWHWLSDFGHVDRRPLNPSWLSQDMHVKLRGGFATREEAMTALGAATTGGPR